jgi:hypothetical protein
MVLGAAKWTERNLMKSGSEALACFALSNAPRHCIKPELRDEVIFSKVGVVR